MKRTVVKQWWIESERGWGVRPDGYSLHLSEDARKKFVSTYWASMPKEVPDEYSRPDGPPEQVEVDQATYSQVVASGNGIRKY